MCVIVLGSINMDLVARVKKSPVAGETVTGESFCTTPGGKGANQAVACSLAGADVRFIGRVGDDSFADGLIDALRTAGIDTATVIRTPGTSSGVAPIIITEDSQNRIIVIPGANAAFDSQDIDNLNRVLPQASSVLLQLEIPMRINVTAAALAHGAGTRVILDPAPAAAVTDELLRNVDIITPNQSETHTLTGIDIDGPDSAARAIKILNGCGVATPIIKMGLQGICWLESGEIRHQPAFRVKAIDTVAAGDAFNGGLAAALDKGASLSDAVAFAQATAAICVTRRGAQQAMGRKDEIENLLAENGYSLLVK